MRASSLPMSTRSPTASRRPSDDARDTAWYRQSIVWIGAAVFAASIAGCVWLIVVAERYDDPPLPIGGLQILKMPLAQPQPKGSEPPP